MKILLTGATGYLGSRLLATLLNGSHSVTILKRRTSKLDRINCLTGRYAVHDLEDGLPGIYTSHQTFDAIVHCATCYGRNGESATEILQANTVFPLALLTAALQAGIPLFLDVGTGLDPMTSPYALSKRQFAEWGRLLSQRGGVVFIETALEHFYGPGDDDTKFVTMLVRRCLGNAAEIPLTAGEQFRDFLHVDDATAALTLLLTRGLDRSPGFHHFPVGSGAAVSIRAFAETIHRLTKSASRLHFGAVPYRPNEAMRSVADTANLRALGWAPQHTLEDGLRSMIATEKQLMQKEPAPCAS